MNQIWDSELENWEIEPKLCAWDFYFYLFASYQVHRMTFLSDTAAGMPHLTPKSQSYK